MARKIPETDPGAMSTAQASYEVFLTSLSQWAPGLQKDDSKRRRSYDINNPNKPDLIADGYDDTPDIHQIKSIRDHFELEVPLVKAGQEPPLGEEIEVHLSANMGRSLGRVYAIGGSHDKLLRANADLILQFGEPDHPEEIEFLGSESGYFLRCCSLRIDPTFGGSVIVDDEAVNNDHYWFKQYVCDTNVPIEAHPNPCFQFLGWTGTAVREGKVAKPTAQVTTVLVDGNYDLRAEFVSEDMCILDINSTPGGHVEVPGEGVFSYDPNTDPNVPILAVDDDPGDPWQLDLWSFAGWSGTAVEANMVESPGDPNTIVRTQSGSYTLVANFKVNIGSTKESLYIYSTSGGSVTTPGEGWFYYDHGTLVTISATPDEFYLFDHWLGGNGAVWDTEAPTTVVTMNDDHEIEGCFTLDIPPTEPRDWRGLAIYSTPGGFVTTPGEGPFRYDLGSRVRIEAEAYPGYHFVNWSGTGIDYVEDPSDPFTSVVMQADCVLKANFEPGNG